MRTLQVVLKDRVWDHADVRQLFQQRVGRWAADRERCRAAGIPHTMGYRPRWQIALEQLGRLQANGVTFDWLTFDEGYGSKPAFLELLCVAQQRYVAEIPTSFSVQRSSNTRPSGPERIEHAVTLGQCCKNNWNA